MSLTTLADVKTAGAINNTDEDSRINLLIPAVDEWVNEFCRREIEQATFTEFTAARGVSGVIHLRNPPVTTPLTSIHVSEDVPRVYDATTLLTEDEDYIVEPDLGIVHRVNIVWPRTVRSIKIVYQGGYATVPSDLARAAIETVLYSLQMSRHKLHHLTGESFGDGEIKNIKVDIPMTALTVFRRYQLPVF